MASNRAYLAARAVDRPGRPRQNPAAVSSAAKMTALRLDLPPKGVLHPNDAHDPLPYYYHPLVGWLYRYRLQMGLDLLPPGGTRVLEVGVGSGVLVPTLTRRYREYTGTDLTLAEGLDGLVAASCTARFT